MEAQIAPSPEYLFCLRAVVALFSGKCVWMCVMRSLRVVVREGWNISRGPAPHKRLGGSQSSRGLAAWGQTSQQMVTRTHTNTHSHGKPRAASRLPPPGGLRTGPKAGARVRGPRQRLVPKLALRVYHFFCHASKEVLNQDLRCVALRCVHQLLCHAGKELGATFV